MFSLLLIISFSFYCLYFFFTVIRVMKQVKKEQDNVSLSLKRKKILITNTLQY